MIRPSGSSNVGIYVTDAHKASASEYAAVAARQQEFFTSTFGQPEASTLKRGRASSGFRFGVLGT